MLFSVNLDQRLVFFKFIGAVVFEQSCVIADHPHGFLDYFDVVEAEIIGL
jgi:hypothetical protein